MKPSLLFLFIFLNFFSYSANNNFPGIKGLQNDSLVQKNNENYILNVKKTTAPIKIDGLISEPDWEIAEKAKDFRLVLPIDSGFAKSPSEVVMTYDDKAFYLGITFFDTIPGKRIMESFRRDFSFGNNDNVLVFFDTFLDQTNGFSFGASASGAKWDGTMGGGGMNLNWDCKWDSKTTQYKDRWVTEMKIPFRSIRFKSGADRWYVNFSRLDLKTNEKSAWAPVPRQFPTASLAHTGVLQWEEPLPKSKMMFSVIPYIYGGAAKDFETDGNTTYRKDFGFDAKLGISTAMNLDLTYNPDYSQAEVDQQVTNIDRFELYYPEKRQFFLENSDLFANYGFGSLTPFFSRRIGLDAPVLAGARLSGKLDKNWRLGLLDMQTEKIGDMQTDSTGNQLSRNFMVASIQRKVFSRSSIGFIFVNKEYMDEPEAQNFNRVAGIDYNLASNDNRWTGKAFYHQSFSPENPGKQYAEGAKLNFNSKRVHAALMETIVGDNYKAETGFVRRTGYYHFSPEFGYLWIPNKKVVSHGPVLDADYYYDPAIGQTDHEFTLSYKLEFSNRSNFEAGMKDFYVFLEEDFDPTHISDTVLLKGTDYATKVGFVDYFSDTRKMFNYSATFAKGGFYSGEIGLVNGQMSYRFQPYLNLSLNFSYTDINLPEPFERAKFWLIGPKVDLTLSDKVFFSTFVQYNEQIENMNVNMRFQWRYKPVSDLFVVYTGNYFTGDWGPRNRALVVKLSYWFN